MTTTFLCTYCNNEFPMSEHTDDHIFARALLPSRAPNQWKVPSCKSCNTKKSRLEGVLRNAVAMSMQPSDQKFHSITAPERRSRTPSEGRDDADRRHREKNRTAVVSKIIYVPRSDMDGLIPFRLENFEQGSRAGIIFPSQDAHELFAMWLCGLHRFRHGENVMPRAKVEGGFLKPEGVRDILDLIAMGGEFLSMGSDVEVGVIEQSNGEEYVAMYILTLWGEFHVFGEVAHLDGSTWQPPENTRLACSFVPPSPFDTRPSGATQDEGGVCA